MTSIPANELVNVVPSVLGVGGSALDIVGLMITTNPRVPIGSVQSFPDQSSVSTYFGATSQEASIAGNYFGGFIGASKIPANILFAQYPLSAVSAYLRGGNISAISLTTLQSYSGTLSVTIDGVLRSASISLAASTSFSSAASIVGAALGIHGAQAASIVGSISGTVMTVSSVVSGALAVGDVVAGTGVTAGTYITALASGTGGVGTYTVSPGQTAGSQAITAYLPGVAYDSVSGAFTVSGTAAGAASTISYGSGALGTSLLLTQATGAVLSQGTGAATPGAFMNGVVGSTMNWVTYMTLFDPDQGSGSTQKQAFAAWKNNYPNRFGYVAWDTDASPTVTVPATSSFVYALNAVNDSGTCPIYAIDATTGPQLAAFVCGAAAAIDFTETNGRITFAYKSQSGLSASVITATAAVNLGGNPQTSSQGNGYNFYGAYGSASDTFTWFQRGFVTGDFTWFDSYINQIWLNNSLQASLLTLQQNSKSIPYTTSGNTLIDTALADPIAAGLDFGAYGPGVLSSSQIAAVNAAASANVATTIQTQGYYLQIKPATPSTRAARTSPPATFWYLDRGSVQAITLASVALQ